MQGNLQFEVGEVEKAIYAKLVQKVGNRHHWEDWANDIAKIARTHIDRIQGILDNPANTKEKQAFFTAGGVRYIDPKHLRSFAAARQAANRLCRASGVRFLSGWAVPDKNLDELLADLTKINQTVEDEKAVLIQNWPTFLGDWIDKNPEVHSYRTRFPSQSYVDLHVGAKLSVYRIHPQATGLGMADGIESEVTGLSARVLQEIAQDVSDTWNPSADKASQRIKNLLERIKHKCETLEFLGGGLGKLAIFVEEALHRLPTQGAITGPDFTILAGILSILSSPKEMKKVTGMMDDGSEQLYVPTQPQSVTVEAEAEAVEISASTVELKPVEQAVSLGEALGISQEPQGKSLTQVQAHAEEIASSYEAVPAASPESVLRQAKQILESPEQSTEETEAQEEVVEEVRISVNDEAAWAW